MTKSVPQADHRLRLVRERLGLTQAEVAEQLRVTRGAVSAWESGHRRLDGPAVVALQAIYGINATWLLTGSGPEEVVPPFVESANLVRLPLLHGLDAWGADGQMMLKGAPKTPWPLPEPLAQRILRESGGGPLDHLVALAGVPGAAPGLSGDAVHVLNAADKVRENPVVEGVYLYRQVDSSRGAFVCFQKQPTGWLARPAGGSLEAPFLVPGSDHLSRVVLGRVCLTGWSWLGRSLG